jgi:hypothetical protein
LKNTYKTHEKHMKNVENPWRTLSWKVKDCINNNLEQKQIRPRYSGNSDYGKQTVEIWHSATSAERNIEIKYAQTTN